MLNLDDREWKEFKLSGKNGIFQNFHGTRLIKKKRLQGKIPLLTAGEFNQGVSEFISNQEMEKYHSCISIDMFGTAFFHEYLCCGDDNIYFFINDKISKECKLFIVNSINQNKINYSYGKQFRQQNADNTIVMLPVNESNKPDFEYMEQFIKEREQLKKNKYLIYCNEQLKKLGHVVQIENLEDKEWKEFFITEVFDKIARGKRLKKANHKKGNKPYVSSTSMNNGVDQFIGNNSGVRIYSNCLSLANSGSVGSCFYEPFEFIASDHVTHLKKDDASKYIYLFLASMLNRLSEKYNFNREINDKRIKREKIFLPCDDEGNPDYIYMEQYVKNLMIDKYTNYKNYIKKSYNIKK